MKLMNIAALALASFLLVSCTYPIMTWKVASSRNLDLSGQVTYTRSNTGPVKEQMGTYLFIVAPLGKVATVPGTIEAAINKAGPGAVALADVTVKETYWYTLLGYKGYEVTGTPIFATPSSAPQVGKP